MTANPLLTKEMFRRFDFWTKDLHKEGVLLNPYWEPWQKFGGDEMGFKPNGGWQKVAMFRRQSDRVCANV